MHDDSGSRAEVLDAAERGGWVRTSDTRLGATSDQFRRGRRTLTCFWPDPPGDHPSGAFLTNGSEGRNLDGLNGCRGVLAALAAAC